MPRREPLSDQPRRTGDGGPSGGSNGLTEVIYEFISVGQAVKVSAIDPATGTEVSIMGPATEPHSALERVALAKLRFVLNKNKRHGRQDND